MFLKLLGQVAAVAIFREHSGIKGISCQTIRPQSGIWQQLGQVEYMLSFFPLFAHPKAALGKGGYLLGIGCSREPRLIMVQQLGSLPVPP